MSLCDGRWIASFLAMTGLGRDDGAGSRALGRGNAQLAAEVLVRSGALQKLGGVFVSEGLQLHAVAELLGVGLQMGDQELKKCDG